MVQNTERIDLNGVSYEVSFINNEDGFHFNVLTVSPAMTLGVVMVHFERVHEVARAMGTRTPNEPLLDEFVKRGLDKKSRVGYVASFYPYGFNHVLGESRKGLGRIMLDRVESVARERELGATYLITNRGGMVRCATKSGYEFIDESTLFKILK